MFAPLNSAIGTSLAPSSPSKTVSRDYAKKAAQTIFTRYPNPKAGPEYLVELVNTLAEQPQWIVDRVADRLLGITAKHREFLPGIGQVIEMINGLREMEDRYARYGDLQARRRPISSPALKPFRPFPRLWEAFAGEPEILDKLDHPGSFDFLDNASRIFATRGLAAARAFIDPPLAEDS